MRLLDFARPYEPAVSQPARAPQLILVQIRDEDGFWCNANEPPTIKLAIPMAERLAAEEKADTRVVRGQKREVIRTFTYSEGDPK